MEIATLGRLMTRASGGRGGLVAIEGPAGIGKTRLLAHARQRAGGSGWRVIDTRCTPMTPNIGYALLRDWFSVLAHRDGPDLALDGPGQVLSELSDDVHRGVGDLVYGARWVLEDLAQDQPVLLVVDDLQWSDVGSLEALDLLISTIQHLPCLVLYAVRTGEPSAAAETLARVRMSSTVLTPGAAERGGGAGAAAPGRPGGDDGRRGAHPRDVGRRAVLRPRAARRRPTAACRTW